MDPDRTEEDSPPGEETENENGHEEEEDKQRSRTTWLEDEN